MARDEATQLQGCVSQSGSPSSRSPTAAHLVGDGGAHIAPDLIAVLIPMLLGQPAREIVAADPQVLFECLSTSSHSARTIPLYGLLHARRRPGRPSDAS
ncbi:SufE family protein [Bradyrhizobium icense]|uniref:SufE family protein n=1 Tax=Bradyrhizobium icense TaxID=1274631 RepID=UPI0009F4E7AF